ncbi:Tn3 family transposase [Saccharopolyspora elongata]
MPALLQRHGSPVDQLGALGLVLNAIVLFNTRYLDAAITELRAGGYEVRDDVAARLSRSCGTTSMCWAAIRSWPLSWPVGCARCAPLPLPRISSALVMRHAGTRGGCRRGDRAFVCQVG